MPQISFSAAPREPSPMRHELSFDDFGDELGLAAPSTTLLDGELAIRAAIVNHRTDTCDIDALISAVLEFGGRRASQDNRLVLQIEASPPLSM